MITLNKIIQRNPCSDGINRLFAYLGKPEGYHGDDVDFPMYEILNSNIIDDCIWAMRCLPEHSLLWRKFAIQIKYEERNSAYVAFWCAKYACSRLSSSHQVLTEKDRHKAKLIEILTTGELVD